MVTGEVPNIDYPQRQAGLQLHGRLGGEHSDRQEHELRCSPPSRAWRSQDNLGVSQPGVIVVQNVLGAGERSGNYRLDGANTTDPAGQWNAQNLMPYDIVEEVQVVKAAKPAEVPFQGGYFNVISKSGGNDFSGTVAAYGSGEALQSSNVEDPVGTTNELVREYELTASLGGRIIPDRLWWYASARSFRGRSNIFEFPAEISEKSQGLLREADLPAERGPPLHLPRHRLGARRSATSSSPTRRRWRWTKRPLPSGLLAGRRSALDGRESCRISPSPRPASTTPDHSFDQLLQPAGDHRHRRLGHGPERARSQGSSAGGIRDQDNRLVNATGSLSWFVPDAAGPHNIKAGLEYLPTSSELLFGEPGDHQLHTCRGFKCAVRFLNTPTQATWDNDTTSLYAQDTWTIADRLTFELRAALHAYLCPHAGAAGRRRRLRRHGARRAFPRAETTRSCRRRTSPSLTPSNRGSRRPTSSVAEVARSCALAPRATTTTSRASTCSS